MVNKYLFLSNLFKVIYTIFLILAIMFVSLGCIGILLFSRSFWQGWLKLCDTFSPFNIANLIMVLLTFTPAIIVYNIHKRFEKKSGVLDKRKVEEMER